MVSIVPNTLGVLLLLTDHGTVQALLWHTHQASKAWFEATIVASAASGFL
jgi:hypothetical protein